MVMMETVEAHQIVQLCCLRMVQLLLQARHALRCACWRLITMMAGAAAPRGPLCAEAAARRAPRFRVKDGCRLAGQCAARMGAHAA